MPEADVEEIMACIKKEIHGGKPQSKQEDTTITGWLAALGEPTEVQHFISQAEGERELLK